MAGEMPAASGKPDSERINVVLQNAMDRMLTRLAQRYDPRIDDRPPLFGTLDPDGLYSIIATWREESWRNAELRHARARAASTGRSTKPSSPAIVRKGRRGRNSRDHAHQPRATPAQTPTARPTPDATPATAYGRAEGSETAR